MDILIATRNFGKFNEIKGSLAELNANFYSPADLGITEDFEETGNSFEENALGKARFFHSRANMITVADDSGIFVDALAGELGLKTRRWGAGEDATDEEWLDYFMERMKGEHNRHASFVCAAALVIVDEEKLFLGETKGKITQEIGYPLKPGIPLSSVFIAEGCDKVYAALGTELKNRLSHRGKAFSQLLNYLKNV